jgi:Hemingway/CFA97
MDRDLPVVNRRIIQRERQNCYEGHRNRLQKIRPMIDNLLPKSAEVKFNKGKKEEMKIERKKVIDIENKILVSKILSIQKNPTKFHRKILIILKIQPFFEDEQPM